jgi:hypothetical protein
MRAYLSTQAMIQQDYEPKKFAARHLPAGSLRAIFLKPFCLATAQAFRALTMGGSLQVRVGAATVGERTISQGGREESAFWVLRERSLPSIPVLDRGPYLRRYTKPS